MLNFKQREAVEQTEGPVMVIAGPGTGKTQIIAERIAHILANPDLQMDASNILCLTFTESAVVAMRTRLLSLIGSEAYYVKIHTFHSFCNEVIIDNPEKFGSVKFIEDLERFKLLERLIDKLPATSPIKPFGDPYYYKLEILGQITTLKREFIEPEKFEEKILDLENFLKNNSACICEFLDIHAKKIKDETIDKLLEEIYSKSIDDSQKVFYNLIDIFYRTSSKSKDFKDALKKFYDTNLKNLPKQKDFLKIYKEYLEFMKNEKLFDYEDMIIRVNRYFSNDKDLLAHYQEKFQYILVDEYQDTNGSQNKLVELLASYYKDNPNLFVVGDDDQSIFRFQGASIENIFHFYKSYKDRAKIIVLEKNYRSTQNILDLSKLSIENNLARIINLIPDLSKKLISDLPSTSNSSVEIHEYKNIVDEVYFIAKKILELISEGVEPNQIAVLYRENKDAEILEETFSRMKVPYSLKSGENILDNIEICQLIDLLKFIENPESRSYLFFNLLNYDFIFYSSLLRENQVTELDVLTVNRDFRKHRNNELDDKETSLMEFLDLHPKFSKFSKKVLEWKKNSLNMKLDSFLEALVNEFGFLKFVLKEDAFRIIKINNLHSFFQSAKSFIETYKSNDLKLFIQYLEDLKSNRLKILSRELQINSNAVNLMTAHKSKGLEFDYVFIHKLNDNHWGNKIERRSLKLPTNLIEVSEPILFKQNANEEERRLFYVAMTRAKKKLFINYHKFSLADKPIMPSVFISEIKSDKSLFEEIEHIESENDETLKLETLFNSPCRIESFLALEKDFISSLLENYKLSVTHLNNFLKCPRLFLFRNLLMVPQAKNKHACFGTAIHKALYEYFIAIKSKEINFEKKEFLFKNFEKFLKDEGLNEKDFLESLEFGRSTLESYFNEYLLELNKDDVSRASLEYDFSSFGLNLDGLALTGKLDKIELVDDSTINVVDYKTGKPDNKSSELKPKGDYFRQIAFYQLLCDLAKSTGQFKYKMISGEIDFVQKNSKDKFVKSKIVISKNDLDDLKEEIKDMNLKIREQRFDKVEDRSICQNCDFRFVCWED